MLLLHYRRGPTFPPQHGSRRCGFFAGVAHTNGARGIPDPRRSRDVANFFAVLSQQRVRPGDYISGKNELNALAVDLPAGAYALDDLLAGVAAFGVADVAVLQAGFVGDLFFAEVVAEPRHALSEASGAKRRVTHRRAFVPASRIRKNLPELRQLFALGEELSAGDSSRRALDD